MITDPFERNEFACACVLSASSGGGEVVVGSINRSVCIRCAHEGNAYLCNHKQACATASFSTLDARVPSVVGEEVGSTVKRNHYPTCRLSFLPEVGMDSFT